PPPTPLPVFHLPHAPAKSGPDAPASPSDTKPRPDKPPATAPRNKSENTLPSSASPEPPTPASAVSRIPTTPALPPPGSNPARCTKINVSAPSRRPLSSIFPLTFPFIFRHLPLYPIL